MRRFIHLALAVPCGALLAAAPAQADPYMYGIGASAGTVIVPGQYPYGFPPAIGDAGTMPRVGGDLLLGLDGFYYADANTRFGLGGRLDFAKAYFDGNVMIRYDYLQPQGDDIDVLAGLGLGIGSQKWSGYADEKLVVNYIPARGEVGLAYRNGEGMLQLLAFAQYDIPTGDKYLDWDGSEQDVGTGFYLKVGIELGVFVGDFKPPKKKATPKPPPKTPSKPTKPPAKPPKKL